MSSLVQFTSSGTYRISSKDVDASAIPTRLAIFNTETGGLVSITGGVGTVNFTIPDAHPSLDTYYLAPTASGYLGECSLYSGLSPTTEVFSSNFIPVTQSSGTLLFSRDFEDALPSGFNFTLSNSGNMTQSGVVSGAKQLEGSYYLGLTATFTAGIFAEPTNASLSGITSGRASFVSKVGTATTSGHTTAFVFMRQSPGITGSGYKVAIAPSVLGTDKVSIGIYAGTISDSNGQVNGQIANSNTVFSSELDWSTNALRNADNRLWTVIEWQVLAKGTLFKLYTCSYATGDTYTSIRSKLNFLGEAFWTGGTSGIALYSTTTEKVAWALTSNSTTLGQVGVDLLTVESLTTLPDEGINALTIFDTNTDVSANQCRPVIRRTAYNPVGALEGPVYANRQGVPLIDGFGPFVTLANSTYNKKGSGPGGLEIFRSGGISGDFATVVYGFKPPTASGIKVGVFRACIQMSSTNSTSRPQQRFGFSFMRQSNALNASSYVVELVPNATANTFNFRIRKGATTAATISDNTDFTGTILATGTDILDINNSNNSVRSGFVWVEIRWRALTSKTQIECLYCPVLTTPDNSEYPIDSSPGPMDYRLVTQLTYEDVVSPLLTTSESPLVFNRQSDQSGTVFNRIASIELRRAKDGN